MGASARITASRQEAKDPKMLGFKAKGGWEQCVRNRTCLIASEIIQLLLFSPCRMYTEQRKYAEMKVDAEKNVNKYFRM